jgi:hypothetical protein
LIQIACAVTYPEMKKPLAPEGASGRGISPNRSVYEQGDQDDDWDRYAEEKQ